MWARGGALWELDSGSDLVRCGYSFRSSRVGVDVEHARERRRRAGTTSTEPAPFITARTTRRCAARAPGKTTPSITKSPGSRRRGKRNAPSTERPTGCWAPSIGSADGSVSAMNAPLLTPSTGRASPPGAPPPLPATAKTLAEYADHLAYCQGAICAGSCPGFSRLTRRSSHQRRIHHFGRRGKTRIGRPLSTRFQRTPVESVNVTDVM